MSEVRWEKRPTIDPETRGHLEMAAQSLAKATASLLFHWGDGHKGVGSEEYTAEFSSMITTIAGIVADTTSIRVE